MFKEVKLKLCDLLWHSRPAAGPVSSARKDQSSPRTETLKPGAAPDVTATTSDSREETSSRRWKPSSGPTPPALRSIGAKQSSLVRQDHSSGYRLDEKYSMSNYLNTSTHSWNYRSHLVVQENVVPCGPVSNTYHVNGFVLRDTTAAKWRNDQDGAASSRWQMCYCWIIPLLKISHLNSWLWEHYPLENNTSFQGPRCGIITELDQTAKFSPLAETRSNCSK